MLLIAFEISDLIPNKRLYQGPRTFLSRASIFLIEAEAKGTASLGILITSCIKLSILVFLLCRSIARLTLPTIHNETILKINDRTESHEENNWISNNFIFIISLLSIDNHIY